MNPIASRAARWWSVGGSLDRMLCTRLPSLKFESPSQTHVYLCGTRRCPYLALNSRSAVSTRWRSYSSASQMNPMASRATRKSSGMSLNLSLDRICCRLRVPGELGIAHACAGGAPDRRKCLPLSRVERVDWVLIHPHCHVCVCGIAARKHTHQTEMALPPELIASADKSVPPPHTTSMHTRHLHSSLD